MSDDYRVNMILDNLPVAMVKMRAREDTGESIKTYERGYPVGFVAGDGGGAETAYLHNHLRFTVLYHKDVETDLSRIVGFEVEPFSVQHKAKDGGLSTCDPASNVLVTHEGAPQAIKAGEEVTFTYDVLFRLSDIRWASRWDTYLLMGDEQV